MSLTITIGVHGWRGFHLKGPSIHGAQITLGCITVFLFGMVMPKPVKEDPGGSD